MNLIITFSGRDSGNRKDIAEFIAQSEDGVESKCENAAISYM